MGKGTCTIDGCGGSHEARGWCRRHYRSWQSTGDPLAVPARYREAEARRDVAAAVATRSRADCWTDWRGGHQHGYPTLGKGTRAGHVSMEASGRPRPPSPGDWMLHSCDVRECWNPDHLSWGDEPQNREEALSRFRFKHGETHRSAVLTAGHVRAIRAAHADGASLVALGRAYGVAPHTIKAVVSRRTWKHVA